MDSINLPSDFIQSSLRDQFLAQEAGKARELATLVRSQGFGAIKTSPPPKMVASNRGKFTRVSTGFNTGFAFAFNNDVFNPASLTDNRINEMPFFGYDNLISQREARDYFYQGLPVATNVLLLVKPNIDKFYPYDRKDWDNKQFFINSLAKPPIDLKEFVFVYYNMPATPDLTIRPGNYLNAQLAIPQNLADELVKLAGTGNPIEDFLQTLFPNITGVDRSTRIARYKADKLEIIDRRTSEETRRTIKLDPPIGEYLTADPKAKEPISA